MDGELLQFALDPEHTAKKNFLYNFCIICFFFTNKLFGICLFLVLFTKVHFSVVRIFVIISNNRSYWGFQCKK